MSSRNNRNSRSLSAQLAAVLLAAGSVAAVAPAMAEDPTPATETTDAAAAEADKAATEATEAKTEEAAKAETEAKRPANPCAPRPKKKRAKNPCE